MKNTSPTTALYSRIREILESARANIARSVNTTQVVSNWLVGREIVEEEQKGQDRAEYGEELLKGLSGQLGREYGRGFSVSALQYMALFSMPTPRCWKNNTHRVLNHSLKLRRRTFPTQRTANPGSPAGFIPTSRGRTTAPSYAWTRPKFCAFYEIEAIANNWAARELERQINSLLYERLALSKDKKRADAIDQEGQEI